MPDLYPSQFLFVLSKLSIHSTRDVEDVIGRLAFVYEGHSKHGITGSSIARHSAPPGQHIASSLNVVDKSLQTRIRKRLIRDAPIDSGYASAEDDSWEEAPSAEDDFTETIELVRSDQVERDFAIRWLTGFIALSCEWVYPVKDPISDDEVERREALVERAASLLSVSADVNEDEDETLSRSFEFPLASFPKSIHIELGDLMASGDHSSVGLQSWASAIHFARMMAADPSTYGLDHTRPLRILELGAGTGMLSIAAAKIIHELRVFDGVSDSETDIIATDYHPDVLANLQANIDLNLTPSYTPSVSVLPLDWQFPDYNAPFDRPFESILAADVVYDPHHASWIKDCVSHLLMKPSAECPEGGVFWMIIALRNIGRHEGLAAGVFNVFPKLDEAAAARPTKDAELSLKTVMVRDLERSGGVGRVDESGYRLFKICWALGYED